MDYLVIRLYGPMASWGEIAVGEVRRSGCYPGKSAVSGLLAAALGDDRAQDQTHLSLAEGYQQAVKLLSSGRLLKDYHTVQAPDSAGKFRYRTRRDELILGKERLGTLLSSREYRTDAQAIVAIQARSIAPYSLQELKQALESPRFHLYLGRKSCPLAAPLAPQLIQADNFRQALDNYRLGELLIDAPEWSNDQRWLANDQLTHYYWEGNMSDFSANEDGFDPQQVQTLKRYDKSLSRVRWQFQPRTEHLWLPQGEVS